MEGAGHAAVAVARRVVGRPARARRGSWSSAMRCGGGLLRRRHVSCVGGQTIGPEAERVCDHDHGEEDADEDERHDAYRLRIDARRDDFVVAAMN